MKSSRENKLCVLSILSDNLNNPQPQVVNIEKIADKLKLNLKETRQLLLRMNQDGEIQSDPDGIYSLITLAGLTCLQTSTRVQYI